MRKVTRQVAFEPTGWTHERRRKVRELFEGLAGEWHTRIVEGRDAALLDALDRGGVGDGRCLEIGCGIGVTAEKLLARFRILVAVDLAAEMLRRTPPGIKRVQADAAQLPLRDGWADVVILENMLLFPLQVARVLAPGGRLVWINSLGDRTPIHLPAEDVAAAMPGEWSGVASQAGWGTWCVLHRTQA